MNKQSVSVLAATILSLAAIGQRNRPANAPVSPVGPPPVPQQNTIKSGPKPYHEVITAKAKTSVGLFTVHKVEDKVYFELADSLLNRDLLVVSRLAKAGADMRSANSMNGYAGDVLNQSVIKFEKGPNNRLFIREVSYSERSKDSSAAMFKAVMNSNIQPITQTFDIRALHTDSASGASSVIIDMTEVINSDNELFFFGGAKGKFGIGGYQQDKSYMLDVKTFPINTEIRTIKTYGRAGGTINMSSMNGMPIMPPSNATKSATLELNTSIVLLPKVPMQARYADDRVGYFTSSYTDFDANPQGVKRISFIERWRMEPKEADREKYKRGELVEPKEPIVIYIDPETPAQWVPYLMQGINDWGAAFEAAGFKNAIKGQLAPTPQQDPSWSLEDARHSAIVYKPSAVPNASGPHIVDPRSGEVLETHINWYHNVMELVHDWYFVQAAAVDPAARSMHFPDTLMGQLIRFVSSHEVGHTLGLLHNFGSSSATPVEKMRDKKWVEANGHTASIMDYARFNYVAQPEDNITGLGLFPRIGVYDKWAIEWGYRLIPEANEAAQETPVLNKWIIAKSNDKRYWFGNETNSEDPRSQNEDLGDNAMKAGEYGIKNLERIMQHLPEWTKEPNDGYDNLKSMHVQVYQQFSRYIGHVIRNIGGRYETPKSVEQPGAVYELVPATTQAEAMRFLAKHVFTTPNWLIDKKVLAYTGSMPLEIISNLQENTLSRLIGSGTVTRLWQAESYSAQAYTMNQFFTDLQKGIFGELDSKSSIDLFRRSLQNQYVDKLASVILPVGPNAQVKTTDITAVIRGHLASLRTKMRTALPVAPDNMTKYHLQGLISKIDQALDNK